MNTRLCIAVHVLLVLPIASCHFSAADAELEPTVILAINGHPEFTSGLGGSLYFRLPDENAGSGMRVLKPDEWPRNFTLSTTLGLRGDNKTALRWKLCVRGTAWAYWPAVLWPFEYTDEPFGASGALVASIGVSM